MRESACVLVCAGNVPGCYCGCAALNEHLYVCTSMCAHAVC